MSAPFYIDMQTRNSEERRSKGMRNFCNRESKKLLFTVPENVAKCVFVKITTCYKMAHGLLFKKMAIHKVVLAARKRSIKTTCNFL